MKSERKDKFCQSCGQPMLPKGVKKLPNEYDHAQGCPEAAPSRPASPPDNIDTCLFCSKEVPPGPDFCSDECALKARAEMERRAEARPAAGEPPADKVTDLAYDIYGLSVEAEHKRGPEWGVVSIAALIREYFPSAAVEPTDEEYDLGNVHTDAAPPSMIPASAYPAIAEELDNVADGPSAAGEPGEREAELDTMVRDFCKIGPKPKSEVRRRIVEWAARAAVPAPLDLQPLKDACDRDWKDETPEQVVAIAANAIYWRGRADEEIIRLKKKLAIARGLLAEYLDEDRAAFDRAAKESAAVPAGPTPDRPTCDYTSKPALNPSQICQCRTCQQYCRALFGGDSGATTPPEGHDHTPASAYPARYIEPTEERK